MRKQPHEIKENINKISAKTVMLENLSAIKRPVLNVDNTIHVGFSEKTYQEIFSKK